MLCFKSCRNPMQSRNALQLEFLEQCMVGDELKVRNMLSSRMVDPSYRHPVNGWTALHWAARRGHTNICLILLENGFSEEVKDKNNQTPFEVCSEDNETLRALLRPESWNEENMPEAVGKRRCSADSNQNDRFVPNYIKHPPFPYSKASSFDGGTTLPSSPVSPLSNGTGYYSYGRRGSVNRTRFLLVRTCCADGKQAFKRVTLPGGSSVAQLKKMIEKSMRNGEVKSIVTLPDRVLIEEDSQIAQFADCQKVEVVYASTEDTKNGINDKPAIDPIETAKCTMETEEKTHTEEQPSEPAAEPDNFPISLIEPIPELQLDAASNTVEENSSSEGFSATTPPELIPSTVSTPVEIDENNHLVEEVDSAQKISLRKSVDSDPGDFVKIDGEDNGNNDEHNIVPAETEQPPQPVEQPAPVEEKKEEEKKKEEEHVETKTAEVEKPVEPSKDIGSSEKSPAESLMMWLRENPSMVHCVATAAVLGVVASIAGIVYAKRIRSYGV